jgi:hypothetical protein
MDHDFPMDSDLIEEINEAVDRGDEQVKQELLEQFGEIIRFAEGLSLDSGLTGKGVLSSTPHPLAPDTEGIVRLVMCLSVFQDSDGHPPRIAAWHLKASAWSMANAGLWDEFPTDL